MIEKNLIKFKQDLNDDKFSNEYIVRKYLCNGSSPVLTDETIFDIKHSIAEHFKIHPNEIILTGSGKLGFSIAPNKRYKHFGEDSDIDIAIISETLFDAFWRELLDFNINWTSRTRRDQEEYNKFNNYFFQGWIRPDLFPFHYKNKKIWFDFFRDLTYKFYPYGEHKIAAGIYKNFTAFEIYNIKNLRLLRQEIQMEKSDGTN